MDLVMLEEMCKTCTKCELHKTRNNIVFGKGDTNTNLMFVGEAPGEQEDKTGIPFVGKSGQLFDKILAAIDLSRDEIFISNIVKCRPPKNRNPREEEKQACLPYLRKQVSLIHPKIIVCLGRVAAQTIIKPDLKITREHGVWFEKAGYYMIATYHPSALLRDASRKPEAWEDYKKIKAKYIEINSQ